MEELWVVNKRRGRRKTKRRRTYSRKRTYRRRRNPGATNPRPKKRRSRYYRRGSFYRTRRNPTFLGAGSNINVKQALEVAGGAMGSRFVGGQILNALAMTSTGLKGYIGDLAAGFVIAKGSRALFRSPSTERNIMLGAVVGVVTRVVNDLLTGGSLIGQSRTLDRMIGNRTLRRLPYRSAVPSTRLPSRLK